MKKRILSVLLSACMLLGTVPPETLAWAEETTTPKAIVMGTTALEGAQKSYVYYGSYQQTSYGSEAPADNEKSLYYYNEAAVKNGQSGYYQVEPVKWRVLATDHDYDSSNEVQESGVFLLSDKNLDTIRFNFANWDGSNVRSWLNGNASEEDSFLSNAFTVAEQQAIATTYVVSEDPPGRLSTNATDNGSENTKDRIFLLSKSELTNSAYGFSSGASRVSNNTGYVYGGGSAGINNQAATDQPGEYFLRTRVIVSSGKYRVYVKTDGIINGTGTTQAKSVRPAMHIEPASVLFSSPAKDGKAANGLTAVGTYSGKEYKLTVTDTSRKDFSARVFFRENRTMIKYENAATGDNEYISALIKNGEEVKYYGRLCSSAGSGSVRLSLPSGYDEEAGDELYIFNEQCNGDCKTDYASPMRKVSPNGMAQEWVYVNGVDLVNEDEDHYIPCGRGSASYDPATRKLTLNNADITVGTEYNNLERYGILISDMAGDVTIELKGKSVIRLTDQSAISGCVKANNKGISKKGITKLTINGEGELAIEVFNDVSPAAIATRGDLEVQGATLSCKLLSGSKQLTSVAIGATESITLDNAKITSMEGFFIGLNAKNALAIKNHSNLTATVAGTGAYSSNDFSINDSEVHVTVNDSSSVPRSGIYTVGNLTLTNSQVESHSGYGESIYAEKKVTVSGGKLTAISDNGMALHAIEGMTVNNNAEVEVNGKSRGIYTTNVLEVTKGKVHSVSQDGYPVLAYKMQSGTAVSLPSETAQAIALGANIREIKGGTIHTEDWTFSEIWDDRVHDNVLQWHSHSYFVNKEGTELHEVSLETAYDVVYKDGKNGQIFADQTYLVKAGAGTPGFQGTLNGLPSWSFLSWLPDKTEEVTQDTTYTAQWRAKADNLLRLHGNGGMDQDSKDIFDQTTPEKSIQIPESPFKKIGYQQSGWFTKAQVDETGTWYQEEGTVNYTAIHNEETMELYAQWSPISYTIAFDSNNGQGTMDTMPMTYDKAEKLTENRFQRAGYTFDGWNTQADGKGDQYSDQQQVSNLTSANQDKVSLYAQWKDEEAPTGTIKVAQKTWSSLLSQITWEQFFKEHIPVMITAEDTSGETVTIEYLFSETALDAGQLATATFMVYSGTLTIDRDQACIIYAKLTDPAGNCTYIQSDGLIVDTTKPVISGITNNGIYCQAQTFTVMDTNLKTVKVNGSPVTLGQNNAYVLQPAECSYTIEAQDYAGNVSDEIVVTINGEHTLQWKSENGHYWQKCKYCDYETEKQTIPVIHMHGADRVCKAQDYTVHFAVPEGVGLVKATWHSGQNTGELTADRADEVYTATAEASNYEKDASAVTVRVYLKTVDGYEYETELTASIQAEHSGGTAYCNYPKVCQVCGECYGQVDASNHSKGGAWEQTPTSHVKKYKCCGEVISAEEAHQWKEGSCQTCGYVCIHDGGEASCSKQAECKYCGDKYGALDMTNHTGSPVWNSTQTHHEESYDCCHEVTTASEEHKWENGVCKDCGYVCQHKGGEATCTDQAVCEICKEHYGSIDPDNHTQDVEWIRTEEAHTQQYKCCKKVLVPTESHEWEDDVCKECGYGCDHEGGTATCISGAICEICGHEYGETDPANHTGTPGWYPTETHHEEIYDCCGAISREEEPHTWEHGVCKECGYVCQHQGGEATCSHLAECEICGEDYGELAANSHKALVHVEGKEPTRTDEGLREHWKCEDCGKRYLDETAQTEATEEALTIPKLEEATESPAPTKPVTTTEPTDTPAVATTNPPTGGTAAPTNKPSGGTSTTKGTTKSPKTGDETVLFDMIVLVAASCGALLLMAGAKKKKKRI